MDDSPRACYKSNPLWNATLHQHLILLHKSSLMPQKDHHDCHTCRPVLDLYVSSNKVIDMMTMHNLCLGNLKNKRTYNIVKFVCSTLAYLPVDKNAFVNAEPIIYMYAYNFPNSDTSLGLTTYTLPRPTLL